MVPPRRQRLADKPCPGEGLRIPSFGELRGAEAVARSGEGLDRVFGGVRGGEVGVSVKYVFCVCDLHVKGFGNEEVDAVAEVFEVANSVYQAGSGGDEGERGDSLWDEEALG